MERLYADPQKSLITSQVCLSSYIDIDREGLAEQDSTFAKRQMLTAIIHLKKKKVEKEKAKNVGWCKISACLTHAYMVFNI